MAMKNMKKTLKIIGAAIAGLIILLVLAGIILVTLVNPNKFKDQISQAVYQKTGRQLTIAGDIKWSFFPRIAIKVNDVSLGNLPEFKEQDFAKVDEAQINIKILPLFLGRIEAGKVILKNLNVYLIKNKTGQKNWQGLAIGHPAMAAQEAPAPAKKKWWSINLISLSGINIANANIFYYDQQANKRAHARVDLQANFRVNPEAQTLGIENLFLQINNMLIRGNVAGTNIVNQPAFSGRLNIPDFNLRQFLESLGQIVNTQDETALQKFAAQITFHSAPAMINFNAVLDDSKIQGDISKLDLKNKIINFAITADKINTNRYKSKPEEEAKPVTAEKKPSAVIKQLKPDSPVKSWSGIGSIKIKQLTAQQLLFGNFNMGVNADRGIINLTPIHADFYQGALNASSRLNTRGTVLQISATANVSNTDLQPLISDYANITRFSGMANININITSQGMDSDTIFKNLNGSGRIDVKNGTLQGVNIPYLIESADSLIHKKPLPPKTANVTDFGDSRATFIIKDGVLSNNDFLMNAPLFQVSGKGTANLTNQQLNYQLNAAKVRDGKVTPMLIPIKVTGTFANPKFSPDLKHAVKNALRTTGKKAAEQIISGQDIRDAGKEITKSLKGLFR